MTADVPAPGPAAVHRRLTAEIWIVLGLSLGQSGVYAVVNIAARLTAGTPLAEQTATLRAALDSLRKLNPARQDSIFNGADDDASGSAAVLEIAQQMAARPPRRSVLFVWHTAEEKGLFGSEYFTEHPTVPRDSIVAQINVDMIGRP